MERRWSKQMLLALFNSQLMTRGLLGDSRSVINLPGWRWGTIKQIPLVAVSRPLHSGVCETRQDAGLPVLHSKISDSGLLRTRGGQQYLKHLFDIGKVPPNVCISVLSSTSMSGAEICCDRGTRFRQAVESRHLFVSVPIKEN